MTMPPIASSRLLRKSRLANTNTAIAAAIASATPSRIAAPPPPRRAAQAAQIGARDAQRGDVPAHDVQRVDAPDGEQALQRHVGRYRQHDQYHQGLEVAAAEPDQRLAATTRSKGHAEAEQESADQVGQPGDPRRRVDRLRQVDQARRFQRRRAGDRDGDRQQPHAHPAPVADVHDVGDRAHRAEVDAVGDRAEDKGQREGEPGDECRKMARIRHGRRLSHARSRRPSGQPRLTPIRGRSRLQSGPRLSRGKQETR